MSEEKKNPSDAKQHKEAAQQRALEQSEVKEVLVFFRRYAKPAAAVVILICALFLFDSFLKKRKHGTEIAADAALMDARSEEQLREVAETYASTAAGPFAVMELARQTFNSGDYVAAATLYEDFLRKYSRHELAGQAALNLINCKEAEGRFDEAEALYRSFAEEHAESYLAPAAHLGRGRCLEALGRLDEARTVYEDMMVAYPDSGWARMAEVSQQNVANQLP